VSAELAIQQAVIAALRADATLISLLATHAYEGSPTVPGVYEYVPQADASESDVDFPYVVAGDMTGAEFDTDDLNGQDHTLTLHVWDRYRGRKRVRQVLDAIYVVLHRASLAVSGQTTIFCYWEFSQSMPDPDPETQHGVTRFRILTQET